MKLPKSILFRIFLIFVIIGIPIGVALAAATGDRLKAPVMIGQGTAVTEKIVFDLGLGGSNPYIQSNSSGALSASTSGFTTDRFYSTSGGTVTNPGFSFGTDTDTGIYQDAPGEVKAAVNGVNKLTIDASNVSSAVPVLAAGGSAGAPEYSFTGDTNTGMYRVTADSLGFATGGTNRVTIDTATFASSLAVDGHRFFSDIGATASAPAFSFTGDTDTGMYQDATGEIDFTVNGTKRLTVDTATVTSTLPLTLAGHGGNTPFNCTVRSNSTGSVSVSTKSCNANEIVVGGGGLCSTGNVTNTLPTSATTWQVACSGAATTIDVYAICCTQ